MKHWMTLALIALNLGFSWEENQIRYLAPMDLLLLIDQKFPVAKDDGTFVSSECVILNNNNRGLVGDNTPASGMPLSPSPTPAFIQYYVKCLEFRFDLSMKTKDAAISERFFGPDMVKYVAQGGNTYNWKSIPEETQKSMITHIVTEMLGPSEVIADRGYASGTEEVVLQIMKQLKKRSVSYIMDHVEVSKRAHIMVALREEFMSY